MADVRSGIDRLAALGLDGDRYRVEQHLVRNKYTVYDANDEAVLEGKQKLLKLKEEFPFETPDGTPAFTVKAQQVLDVAGDYAIQDAETGETLLVLGKQFTIFHHKWTISSPEGELLARVESDNRLLDVLRSLHGLFELFPYHYEIRAPDGRKIGSIDEHFSLRDKYDVVVDDPGSIPRAALVAAGVVIDALEGQ